jgi:hypothetical protein
LFPDFSPEELEELAESIKRDGQQEPAVIYEGQLLDGKNRQAACKLAGKELKVVTLEPGIDPTTFVIQRNLLRRNLTTGQRAAIGVTLKEMLAKDADKRMKAGVAQDPSANLREGSKASEEAANLVKVSARTIEAAEKVQRESPALFKEVAAGRMTVNAAVGALPESDDLEPLSKPRAKHKPFLVLCADLADVREQPKFYNRKSYPNIAFFHLWNQATPKLVRMGWSNYDVLFTVLGSEEKQIESAGVSVCRSNARFLSLSLHGKIPVPVVVPPQVIEDGLDGVIKAVGEAWPNARKILVSNLKRAPKGWELLNEQAK